MLNYDEVQRLVFERLDELLNVRIAEDQVALAIKQVGSKFCIYYLSRSAFRSCFKLQSYN